MKEITINVPSIVDVPIGINIIPVKTEAWNEEFISECVVRTISAFLADGGAIAMVESGTWDVRRVRKT